MSSYIFYLGIFYILVGTIYLIVPLIYLELGKPKDLIRAFLNLLIGFILIIKSKTIGESFFLISLLLTALVVLYVFEISYDDIRNIGDQKNYLNKFSSLYSFLIDL